MVRVEGKERVGKHWAAGIQILNFSLFIRSTGNSSRSLQLTRVLITASVHCHRAAFIERFMNLRYNKILSQKAYFSDYTETVASVKTAVFLKDDEKTLTWHTFQLVVRLYSNLKIQSVLSWSRSKGWQVRKREEGKVKSVLWTLRLHAQL